MLKSIRTILAKNYPSGDFLKLKQAELLFKVILFNWAMLLALIPVVNLLFSNLLSYYFMLCAASLFLVALQIYLLLKGWYSWAASFSVMNFAGVIIAFLFFELNFYPDLVYSSLGYVLVLPIIYTALFHNRIWLFSVAVVLLAINYGIYDYLAEKETAKDFSVLVSFSSVTVVLLLATAFLGLFNGMMKSALKILQSLNQVSDNKTIKLKDLFSSTHIVDGLQRTSWDLIETERNLTSSIETINHVLEKQVNLIDLSDHNFRKVVQSLSSQNSLVNETGQRIKKMGAFLGELMLRADEFESLATATRDKAKIGESRAHESVAAIRQISKINSTISEHISIIKDISDKINMLSLNASIEASRAGVHGRGFQVVAEEIGKLADKTAATAAEIAKIVEEEHLQVAAGNSTISELVKLFFAIAEGLAEIESFSKEMHNKSVISIDQCSGVSNDARQLDELIKDIKAIIDEQGRYQNQLTDGNDKLLESRKQAQKVVEKLTLLSRTIGSQSTNLRTQFATLELEQEIKS